MTKKLEIFDVDGNLLSMANVISLFLSDKVNTKSDSDIMIGMRGIRKNIPCLYYITPIEYEPHSISIIKDL